MRILIEFRGQLEPGDPLVANSDYLQSQGRQRRLVPGMLVDAEIHLGTRSVLEYLLSPVQKVA
jgi:hemolysin D